VVFCCCCCCAPFSAIEEVESGSVNGDASWTLLVGVCSSSSSGDSSGDSSVSSNPHPSSTEPSLVRPWCWCWRWCCGSGSGGGFFLVWRDGFVTRHFFSLLRSWVSLNKQSVSMPYIMALDWQTHLGLKSAERICLMTCLSGHSSSLYSFAIWAFLVSQTVEGIVCFILSQGAAGMGEMVWGWYNAVLQAGKMN
jgi:hypothetical protein